MVALIYILWPAIVEFAERFTPIIKTSVQFWKVKVWTIVGFGCWGSNKIGYLLGLILSYLSRRLVGSLILIEI